MRTYRIVLIGSGGVGKSAITFQFIQGVFLKSYDPTIEDSYRKLVQYDGQNFMLEILDTAGTEHFTAMRDLYMRNGHGFILMYSITSEASFHEIQIRREQILRIKETDNVPMILVGNKCDLEAEREIAETDGARLARQFGCPFLETSAKVKINVDELFCNLVQQLNVNCPASKPKNPPKKHSCCIT